MSLSTLQKLGASSLTLAFILDKYQARYSLPGRGILTGSLLFFLLQFVALTFYTVVLQPRYFSPLRHIPEPTNGELFLGQTRRILREPSGIPMKEWISTVKNTGLIRYSVWFRQRVMPTTPSSLAEVLVTRNYDFTKPAAFSQGLARILGVGILLAEGDEHKTQRKNLSPAFSFRHVKEIYPIFWQKSRELVHCLALASSVTDVAPDNKGSQTAGDAPQHAPGSIDVGDWSSRATLDIIGISGMGQDFNSLADPSNRLNQTYKSVFSPGTAGRILQIASIFIPFWLLKRLPLKRNHELNDATNYIKQVCRDMIAKKRERISKGQVSEVDILSVALNSGGFTDEDLVGQMMTFLLAGHETTATSMIWAIYLLCKHKDVQEKLRKEIRANIPSLAHDITPSDIDDCAYLQAFCSEVLRLWAPVSLTMREAAKDTVIAQQVIPKGTIVILAPWAINTYKELWGEDADEFRPERWLNADGKANQNGNAKSNYSFLTFLHGPRSCIGQRFAQAEFAALIAAWVGRYDSSFEEGSPHARGEPEIKGGITAKPKGGLWCTLEEIPGW